MSTPGGLGSGVIIDREGHAITNAHVVQGEQKLKATVWFPQADGTLQRVEIDKVELVAVNNHLDLALLKIEGAPLPAPCQGHRRRRPARAVPPPPEQRERDES